jgi:hypothetical protein
VKKRLSCVKAMAATFGPVHSWYLSVFRLVPALAGECWPVGNENLEAGRVATEDHRGKAQDAKHQHHHCDASGFERYGQQITDQDCQREADAINQMRA